MQNTVRTTIRIRKDLINQSKFIALQRGISLQQVINETLAYGFKHVGDFKRRKEAMDKINQLRENIYKKQGPINVSKLVEQNKKELQERADRFIKTAGRSYGSNPK